MKRAYLLPPITPSRALDRVRQALCADPRCGDDFPEEAAEVVILQVVGRRDQVLAKAREIWARGQQTAIIQYVMRSSKTPHTREWLELWQGSTAVWSYLPLAQWSDEDGYMWHDFQFYHAPLGVDGDVFKTGEPPLDTRPHPADVVMSTGRGWLTESAREVHLAARMANVATWHLGPEIGHGVPHVIHGWPDAELAAVYQHCDYVSGLRRIEGFELPAAEGLLCGARPLLFDREHYRRWYQNSGEYIQEGDRQSVIDQLVDLFKRPVRTVTQLEREAAATRFHWPTLVEGFLTRCLA